jgi:hypothetical protein
LRQSAGFVDAGLPSILKLGEVYPGFYDVGLFLDASTNCMKLLQPTQHVSHKTSVIFRACQMYPSGSTLVRTPGTYALPLVEAWGGYDVTLENFTHIRAESIRLVGRPGDPGRKWVSKVTMRDCSMEEDMEWPLEAMSSDSSGTRWFRWQGCAQRWGGSFDSSGFEGRPYADFEWLSTDLSKIPNPN